jgi:ankyrin repeat protein
MTGANSNLNGQGGRTPLHVAAMEGHREAAITLFKGCPYVDVEARDVENETPLVTAARAGKMDFIRCLMEYRQDLAVPSQQWEMAASRAADNGHFEIVEFFIQWR